MIILQGPNISFVIYKREVKAIEVNNGTLTFRFKDSRISVFSGVRIRNFYRKLCEAQTPRILDELRRNVSKFEFEFFKEF